MVAIFTGLGAGFERGSAASLGAAGLLGASGLGRAGEGVFLNAATGGLLINRQDEFLVGRGPDVAVARTYNSLGVFDADDNGDQWRQSSDRRIVSVGQRNVQDHTVVRVSGDGAAVTYKYDDWDVAGVFYYRATDGGGAHDRLTFSNGEWTWTDGSTHISEVYQDAGQQTYQGVLKDQWRIVSVRDSDLNQLTFHY
jgi:hypothetical protein